MFWGKVLVIIGVVFLLKNLGLISGPAWEVVWPTALIVMGAAILGRHGWTMHGPWCQCARCRGSQPGEGK